MTRTRAALMGLMIFASAFAGSAIGGAEAAADPTVSDFTDYRPGQHRPPACSEGKPIGYLACGDQGDHR